MTDNDRVRGLHRREFLKAGATSLIGLASVPAWAGVFHNGELIDRATPRNPVVLKSNQLELVLDRNDGLPFEYRLNALDTTMRGEDFGAKITVTLHRKQPYGFVTAPLRASSVKATDSQADFHFRALYDGKRAAEFTVRYSVDGPTVRISMFDVHEARGYELIEAALPRLVTVREEDGKAWLAHGDQGGSVVDLSAATAGSLPPNRFWGSVLASLPLVIVANERAICVQETTAFMDGTTLAVAGEPGYRRASLGTIQRHRVNGSLCYDMNLAPPNPRDCGNQQTPNLLIEQDSACRLDFIGDFDGNGRIDWVDGAKLVRSRMPAKPTSYYDDKFEYGIHLDQPLWKEPGATFEEAGELIRQVAALTDHSPQVVQLWGWQFRGKDTGYPSVAEVNERIGGYVGLMELMEEGPKYNCRVTFSDNYDDAYRSSPAWDPALIARRPDGQLWKSRNWTGEDSYILGMAKYMKGAGAERVRYTCERYKLRETTHIDVLSYYAIRNDWDPAHPASGIRNLEEGRYEVLAGFRKHGIDVSSEALRYAFIGKVTWFNYADGLARGRCPFGGKLVPILPLVYRKAAIWGAGGHAKPFPEQMIDALFWNTGGRIWITRKSPLEEVTDIFYLLMVPWFRLHSLNIESFDRDGDRVTIGLENNATIELNDSQQTYSVKLDSLEVAREGSTFCPLDQDRIAFYCFNAAELAAALPAGWDRTKIAAVALDAEKPERTTVVVRDGKIRVKVAARRPVIVYRDVVEAERRIQARP